MNASEDQLRSVLVAGVGNAWLRDDGFGGEVARRLSARELPAGVSVMDAGTGGLDLAYEVMRGYDALVILDVSKQGGDPGTLYVIEPDMESIPTAWIRRPCCASSSRSAPGLAGCW
jgi:hydrogenase maturation protease